MERGQVNHQLEQRIREGRSSCLPNFEKAKRTIFQKLGLENKNYKKIQPPKKYK